MLRITVNGKDVDIPEDISITMNVTNPLFSESGFDEVYSYGFSLFKTARNISVINRSIGKKNTIRILYSNHLVIDGYCIVKEKFDSFSINIKNDSLDLRQQLDELPIQQIEFEKFQIYETADHPDLKISKWRDHMTDTTITASENVGTHKFPWIQANYQLNAEDLLWSRNPTHSNNNFFINGYLGGVFQYNEGENISPVDDAWWLTTVSPCPRIQHIFNKIIMHLELLMIENELEEVPEFLQMVHFSTLVMDLVEKKTILGIEYKFNVHGQEIDLNTFIPDLMAGELFKMLKTLFGIVVFVKGRKIKVKTAKSLLEKPFVDFSKYCNNEYEATYNNRSSIKYIYPIDYNEKNSLAKPKWSYETDITLGGFVWETFNKHETKQIGSGNTIEEIDVNYTPLISIFDYNYLGFARQSRFTYPYNFVSSHYDVEVYNGSDKFIIGLIRGMYPMNISGTYYDRLIFENSHVFDAIAARTGHEYKFGTCSIYLNDASSHVDVYLKRYLEHLRLADEITKTLYLPLHKILEIMSWKEPNHIIKQRNLSFKGTVKEVNFTLYKSSISPVEITYSVVDQAALGDYNDDYNIDFSI